MSEKPHPDAVEGMPPRDGVWWVWSRHCGEWAIGYRETAADGSVYLGVSGLVYDAWDPKYGRWHHPVPIPVPGAREGPEPVSRCGACGQPAVEALPDPRWRLPIIVHVEGGFPLEAKGETGDGYLAWVGSPDTWGCSRTWREAVYEALRTAGLIQVLEVPATASPDSAAPSAGDHG